MSKQRFNKLLRKSAIYFKRDGPSILTGISAVGVVVTTISAVRATPKAIRLIEIAKEEKGDDLTKLEIVKSVGYVYIPSMLLGASTIACIFGANVLNKRNQASLMSAYALLDNSYKEYKNKVSELYGKDADTHIKSEIAKEKYDKKDILTDDKQLFYDFYSGQYFESTMEEVLMAEYNINRDLSTLGYINVNEVNGYFGIDDIEGGDDLGWSTHHNWESYWESWLDFIHEKVELDDGLECIIISTKIEPVPKYFEY